MYDRCPDWSLTARCMISICMFSSTVTLLTFARFDCSCSCLFGLLSFFSCGSSSATLCSLYMLVMILMTQ
ncbi:hypothetical protein PENSPDRAFT_59967 [Peniophora sp. CONT]|nr:hypothetical protein PENSPDRAFT_59967 [Peniophora sp. CONT]